MIPLTAREALDPLVARVTATMRPADLEEGGHGTRLYAVFAEDDRTFLGLVTEQACVRFPQWIFADLTLKAPPLPVAAETSLQEVGRRMAAEGVEALPVLDEQGAYLGAITWPRLLETLLPREQELAAESRRLRERLEGLNQAARTLSGLVGGPSIEGTLLQEGLNALATLLQARYGAITILDGSGGLQQFIFSGLTSGEAEKIGTWPQGKGLLGVVIQENQILRLKDLTQHPRHAGFPPEHPRMKSLLAVPINSQGHIFGQLYLCDKVTEEPFTDEDELLAVSFARSLALTLAHARELGERRRVQEELRDSEAKWRSLVENAPDIICTVDREGRIQFMNRTPAGLTAEQAPGANALDYVVPEHREVVRQAIRRVFETGEPSYFEIAARGPHDSTCWYATRLGPVRRYGEVVAVTLITRDITERKCEEERLLTQTLQLEAVRAVSAEVARELDLPTLLDLIIQRVIGLVGAGSGAIFLWDEADQVLVPRAWCGLGEWMREVRLRLGEGFVGAVAQNWQGIIVNDYQTSAYALPLFLERTRITACLAEPLLYRDQLVGVIGVINDGSRPPFIEQDRETLGLLATQAAIALENARLHSAAVRRGEELGAVLRATRTVMAGLELQEVLGRIVGEAAQIAGTPHAKVMLVDRDAQVLRLGAVTGRPHALLEGFQLPVGGGLSGTVAASGQPLYVPECQHDPRNVYADQDRELGLVTYLGLPITIRDEVVGVLTFNTTHPRRYSSDELAYLASFAAQAAIAIQNARLFEQVRAGRERLQTLSRRLLEAQEAERRFIARELHDEIGQALTAVKLNLQEAQRLAGSSAITPSLDESIGIVNRVLQQVRDLSLDLRPSMLDDLGLVAALRWYVDRHAQRATFTAQFLAEPTEIQAPPDIATTCFRVAQEALTNAARHARAQSVRVEVRQDATGLELVIGDDGVGFDVEAARERAAAGASLGLLGMQERVILAGGQIAIKSAPARGTEIRVRFPQVSPLSRGPRVERRSARRAPP